MSANIKIGATIQLNGANNFKKATTEMGAAVAKFHKAIALTPRQMRDTAEETTLLRKQLDSFKSTVQKTDPALAKVRQELANNLRALRSHGVDVRKVDDTYKKFTTTQNTVIKNSTRMGSALKTAGAVMGGTYAATMVLAQPVKEQMAWDKTVTLMTNTALPRGTAEEKGALQLRLSDAIRTAGGHGGFRDDIAGAMDSMLGSGQLDIEQIIAITPFLNQAAVSSGASAADLSKMLPALKQFGFETPEDMMRGINEAMSAGQAGGYELKDMSKSLPEILALAKTAGLYGEKDFISLLSLMQAGLLTASNPDAAGTNIKNFLSKLAAKETRDRMSKVFDQDLEKLYLDAIKRGMDPITSIVGFMQQQAERDPQYKALQSQLKKTKNKDEQSKLLEQMGARLGKFDENGAVAAQGLIMGGQIGQIFSDQQALLGFLAAMNRDYIADVEQQILAGKDDAVQFTHDTMKNQAWLQSEIAKNNMDAAKEDIYQSMEGSLGSLMQKLNNYGAIYPGLTTSLVGVWEVAKGIGAAGLAYGLVNKLSAPPTAPVVTNPVGNTSFKPTKLFGRFSLPKLPTMGVGFVYTGPEDMIKGFGEDNYARAIQPDRARIIEEMGGEEKARELYQKYGSIFSTFERVSDSGLKGVARQAAETEQNAKLTPTPQQLSQPTLLDLQSSPELLDNFLKSLRNPASQQPQDMQPVSPQVNDHSSRSVNISLNITDERQIIPIVEQAIQRALNADKLARRASMFDDLEAIS